MFDYIFFEGYSLDNDHHSKIASEIFKHHSENKMVYALVRYTRYLSRSIFCSSVRNLSPRR